jgi:hypothetical protein
LCGTPQRAPWNRVREIFRFSGNPFATSTAALRSKTQVRRNLAPHSPELGAQRPLFRHVGRQDDTADPASMQRADCHRGMRRDGFLVKQLPG